MALNLPQFWESPYYKKGQEALYPFSESLLKGEPSEYYAPVGEWGGPEFKKMLTLVEKQTTKGAYEDIIRRGVGRGKLGADIVSKRMTEATTKLTFADMLRAIEGRKYMMGLGTETMAGVRGAGLEFGRQKSAYQLKKGQLEYEAEAREKERKSKMWQTILSSSIGAIGTIAGISMGIPPGLGILGSAKGTAALGSPPGGYFPG